MGPYKPLRNWVDDHPLLYGNNGSWSTLAHMFILGSSLFIRLKFKVTSQDSDIKSCKKIPRYQPVLFQTNKQTNKQTNQEQVPLPKSPGGLEKKNLAIANIEIMKGPFSNLPLHSTLPSPPPQEREMRSPIVQEERKSNASIVWWTPTKAWKNLSTVLHRTGVSKNMGKPPKSFILIWFSIHFAVPVFLETPVHPPFFFGKTRKILWFLVYV